MELTTACQQTGPEMKYIYEEYGKAEEITTGHNPLLRIEVWNYFSPEVSVPVAESTVLSR